MLGGAGCGGVAGERRLWGGGKRGPLDWGWNGVACLDIVRLRRAWGKLMTRYLGKG